MVYCYIHLPNVSSNNIDSILTNQEMSQIMNILSHIVLRLGVIYLHNVSSNLNYSLLTK